MLVFGGQWDGGLAAIEKGELVTLLRPRELAAIAAGELRAAGDLV